MFKKYLMIAPALVLLAATYIPLSKIAGGTAGNIPVSNGTTLVSVTPSGDWTINSSGVNALKSLGTAGACGDSTHFCVPTFDSNGRESGWVSNAVSGGINFADSETPTGTINGSNLTFTLAHTPSPTSSLKVFSDGVRMAGGVDYTLSGATVTFVDTAHTPSNTLLCDYRW